MWDFTEGGGGSMGQWELKEKGGMKETNKKGWLGWVQGFLGKRYRRFGSV